ncbi:MAG: domain containing protein [Marmoricola sp.]|nr:domain containing protein [Marmoricola sp.]
MSTCPNGHQSASDDYCDTCGAPIAAAGAASTPGPDALPETAPDVPAPQVCPNCSTENSATALFCEACGYDFTTGTMPRPPDPVQAPPPSQAPLATPLPPEWVAELWVDPDWYAAQESEDPCPSPGLPVVVPLRSQSVLVGRPSSSRNIHPDVDCSGDTGVSRRQAQLTSDGQRWWVEDLQSSNGTYVGPASGPLPETPLPPGQRRELGDDDRVYLGTWTRLVVRRATPEEQAGTS